ncbi:MAG: VanZ family protein, partial [Clostridium sp.]
LLIIGNVFAYVPIGIYIKYVSRIKNIKLYCYFILYCLIIESIQYIFKLGSFDINDIIMNSAGFIIGVIIISIPHQI